VIRVQVLRKDDDYRVKNVLLRRLSEPDKEVGPEFRKKTCKEVVDKDTDDFHLKPSDATDCSILESEEFLNVSGKIWTYCAHLHNLASLRFIRQCGL